MRKRVERDSPWINKVHGRIRLLGILIPLLLLIPMLKAFYLQILHG